MPLPHLNLVLKHSEGSKTHARLLFVDFSSAFNTIQPHILIDRLIIIIINHFNLDFNVVGWIFTRQNSESEGNLMF